MSELSERIKAAIKASGLSQRDIEIKTGIPQSAIQRYASGNTEKVPIERIEAIALATGTTAERLLGWEDKSLNIIHNSFPISTQNIPTLGYVLRKRSGSISMDIGKRIRLRREELDISAEKLGEMIGKTKTTIYRYESGYIENMPLSILEPIANALHTTPAYLMGWTDEKSQNIIPDIMPISTQRIPMLREIACGKPIICNEDRESYVESGTNIHADFCLRCKGDSMTGAGIKDGDIVFIRAQDMVDNGQIAAVIIDNKATLKRVYSFPKKSKIVFQSENPKYEPLIYEGDELNEIRILGKAVSFQSDVI